MSKPYRMTEKTSRVGACSSNASLSLASSQRTSHEMDQYISTLARTHDGSNGGRSSGVTYLDLINTVLALVEEDVEQNLTIRDTDVPSTKPKK